MRQEEERNLVAKHLARDKSRAGSLGHRLDEHDARHDRIVREVPLEEVVLFSRERVGADCPRLIGGDQLIDEEKRRTMRQKLDSGNVKFLLELGKLHEILHPLANDGPFSPRPS